MLRLTIRANCYIHTDGRRRRRKSLKKSSGNIKMRDEERKSGKENLYKAWGMVVPPRGPSREHPSGNIKMRDEERKSGKENPYK